MENTLFIPKVDKSNVIKFDWGSTNLETFRMDQKGQDTNTNTEFKG